MFFTLYIEGVKSEAAHYRELLDISISPKMKFEYYEHLRRRYDRFIANEKPKLPEKPVDMTISASSPEAREVVFSIFRSMKRNSGYGE